MDMEKYAQFCIEADFKNNTIAVCKGSDRITLTTWETRLLIRSLTRQIQELCGR